MTRLTKDPTDVLVGQRLRLRRTTLGLSQEKLANAVGVSFQQIQKYENGTNRVGAGRLMQISKALDVSVGWFFESGQMAETLVAEAPAALDDTLFQKKETIDLLSAYYSLPEAMRKKVLDIIRDFRLEESSSS